MTVAWGFSQRAGKMFTGIRLKGTLLIQTHTLYAEHSPAREASRPAGMRTRMPLPCPPPGKGDSVSLASTLSKVHKQRWPRHAWLQATGLQTRLNGG